MNGDEEAQTEGNEGGCRSWRQVTGRHEESVVRAVLNVTGER